MRSFQQKAVIWGGATFVVVAVFWLSFFCIFGAVPVIKHIPLGWDKVLAVHICRWSDLIFAPLLMMLLLALHTDSSRKDIIISCTIVPFCFVVFVVFTHIGIGLWFLPPAVIFFAISCFIEMPSAYSATKNAATGISLAYAVGYGAVIGVPILLMLSIVPFLYKETPYLLREMKQIIDSA